MKKSKPNHSINQHKGNATMLSILLVTVSVVSIFFIYTIQNNKPQVEGLSTTNTKFGKIMPTPAPIVSLSCGQCVAAGIKNPYLCLNKGWRNSQPVAYCRNGATGISAIGADVCAKCTLPTISISPRPTCIPRPACLDAKFKCMIAEPVNGWCPPTITPTPTVANLPTPTPTRSPQ